MSQMRDVRLFDWIVILGFVGVVGYFAQRSNAPKVSSIPGVSWPDAPAPAPKLLEEAKPVVEGDPLAPEAVLEQNAEQESGVENTNTEEGAWE